MSKDDKGDGGDPKTPAGDKTPKNDPSKDDPTLDVKSIQAQKEHWREKAKAAEAEATELREAKDKAEREKLESDKKFEELYNSEKEQREKLETKVTESAKKFAFLKEASKHNIVAPEDAFKLIDASKFSLDNDGNVDAVNLESLVKTFAESNPHFVQQEAKTTPKGGSSTPPAGGGGEANPGTQTFTRSQLRDNNFYKANEEAILQAEIAGNITEG
jgi:hypothetical protein